MKTASLIFLFVSVLSFSGCSSSETAQTATGPVNPGSMPSSDPTDMSGLAANNQAGGVNSDLPANPCQLPDAHACVKRIYDQATDTYGAPMWCDATQFGSQNPPSTSPATQQAKKFCDQSNGVFIENGQCPTQDRIVSYIRWSKMPRKTEWNSAVYRVYYKGSTTRMSNPADVGKDKEMLYDIEARGTVRGYPRMMYKCSLDGTVLKTWTAIPTR